MSDGAAFQAMDVAEVRSLLSRLHEQVAADTSRIEIRRTNCDDVCVIISKRELDALERALEILSASAEYTATCRTLHELAIASSEGYAHFTP